MSQQNRTKMSVTQLTLLTAIKEPLHKRWVICYN